MSARNAVSLVICPVHLTLQAHESFSERLYLALGATGIGQGSRLPEALQELEEIQNELAFLDFAFDVAPYSKSLQGPI
jgi:hypothetical protein